MIEAVRKMRQERVRRGFSLSITASASLSEKCVGMRLVPQRIQNQHVQPLEQRPALVGNPAHIGAVRQVPTRKPRTGNGPCSSRIGRMLLAQDLERHPRLDPHELELGDEPRRPVLRAARNA